MVDNNVVIPDLCPDEIEAGCFRVHHGRASMVGTGARVERSFLKDGALCFRRKERVLLALFTAKETFSTVTTDLGLVCILPAHDTVVLPTRGLDAPNVELVNCFGLLNGGVGNVDPERHDGRRIRFVALAFKKVIFWYGTKLIIG